MAVQIMYAAVFHLDEFKSLNLFFFGKFPFLMVAAQRYVMNNGSMTDSIGETRIFLTQRNRGETEYGVVKYSAVLFVSKTDTHWVSFFLCVLCPFSVSPCLNLTHTKRHGA